MSAKVGVRAAADRLWPEQVRFLQELVRRPSPRGETNAVQQLIAADLRDQGLEVAEPGIDLAAISGLPGFSPPEWSYEGLVNVTARAPGAGGGRSLVMNGHVDVVSAEPLGHWTRDPWGAEIEGGSMYGRGAADMKSGIAAMVYALKAVRAAGVRLRGDVLLQSVIDEECTGNGTLACLAGGSVADGCVIAEPSGLSLVSAHPGVLWCRISVRGAGGHASVASSQVNAAEKAMLMVAALRELELEVNRPQVRHPAFAAVEHPLNYNLGTFHAGDWPSSVPELCSLEVRLANYPGEDMEATRAQVRRRLAEAAARDPWLSETPPAVTFFGFNAEPAVYDTDDELSRLLKANHKEVTGQELGAKPFTATIDNRFFQNQYQIPNACYGPVGGLLHAPDEWVDLESVRTVTRTLAGFLLDWCGID